MDLLGLRLHNPGTSQLGAVAGPDTSLNHKECGEVP